MATIGNLVATDLGEPSSFVWYIPAWTIAITICFMLCGANTDLLGRRWFLVLGNLICTVGHIVIACAKSKTMIITGMAITGLGGANCQMAAFALSELLPNKWRHNGVVLADATTLMAVILGPITGRYGFESGVWYWNFAAAAVLQFLTFLGLYFYYFPPAHPYGMSKRQLIKELDYLGGMLFIAGALPILMGIVWTNTYPASDPHVVASLVIGFFFIICFAIWETYGKAKHPLTPTHVFTSSRGRDFTAPAVALGVVNMFYYSSSILWPTMTTAFWATGPEDWRYAIILSLPPSIGITFGALLLSSLGGSLRNWHWQLTGSVFIMVVFGSLLALVTPTNKATMIAFAFVSNSGYGWAIYLSIAVTQMGVEHKDLGISGGIAGVFRFAAGSIAAAIYTTILTNDISKQTLNLVPQAVIKAGLPESQVASFLQSMSNSTALSKYPPAVLAASTEAAKQANVHGIRLVALASMAFGIVGILACLCCKDVNSKMTNKIEVYLENDELARRNKYH
ncbi:hypothetical protein AJ79_07136 [Helicocarpus griseus UAMH5409]|uniref:Major facilitator superfamily (MFS) profile domain-containing protein n=1 Tax=Helicocarpus griseus UAMH5409 TaxID=1447875 RepID=A0A2B7X5X2_9EURO|nr:hypothetical protein AJ79_07136 [Helicocarpus griseus UAMH5409]